MIVKGDARHIPLADNSVQCVVTSPPYWGLRKYAGKQNLVWPVRASKGVVRCNRGDHAWGEPGVRRNGRSWDPTKGESPVGRDYQGSTGSFCQLCGAWRGAFGLEPTIEMYVQHSVEILREVRRVLRADGVCFWNIGDSYCSTAPGTMGDTLHKRGILSGITDACADARRKYRPETPTGLKPKDLCLIPARVALAAQADGWWVRSDIIWNKPNPMPESVRDRPTDAYEHILMLTKSERYYWDAEAVAEQITDSSCKRLGQPTLAQQHGSDRVPGKTNGPMKAVPPRFGGNKYGDSEEPEHRTKSGNPYDGGSGKRNLRNVWTFATQPYKGAHFATFPEELVIRCLSAASKPGDLVMDPFAGSGTVGEVAFNMGRRFFLMDLAYQELQRERVAPMALIEGFTAGADCNVAVANIHPIW